MKSDFFRAEGRCKRLDIKIRSYTLTEILVVLVIIGILILLALPNLMPLITKAKTTEAKMQLEHAYQLQKTYFYEHSKYTTDLAALGYVQEKLSTEASTGNANYRLEVSSATENSFVIRATAVLDFDGDGTFNVWEIDQDKNLRETVQD